MGARDMLGSGVDVDGARMARDERMNPPEYAPGQADDFFDDDLFDEGSNVGGSGSDSVFGGGGNSGGDSIFGNTSLSAGAPTGAWGGLQGQPQQQGFQQPDMRSTEDKLWDGVVSGGKGAISWMKDVIGSFKEVTPKFWSTWGSRVFVVGGAVAILGVIIRLFGVTQGVDFIVSGLVSAGLGGMVLMFSVDKAKNYTSRYKDGSAEGVAALGGQEQNLLGDTSASFGGDSDFEDDSWDDDFNADADNSYGGSSDDDWDDDYDGEGASLFDDIGDMPVQNTTVSTEEALSTMPEVQKGMYTRQFLYEMFSKVLKNIKPDFATVKDIDPDDDVFIVWEKYLREAAEVSGLKEENLPMLSSLEETLFTIKLSCARTTGFKPEVIGNELANIFAYKSGVTDGSVYARTETVGKTCIITIFTGAKALITLKDTYTHCSDYVLDSNNYIPIVLGTDESGKVITLDFKAMESILVTGMPRSGKSWFVLAVITQMCAYLSPKELQFIFCDPKDGISDFRDFRLPHVKKFVTKDEHIVNTLRQLVKVEAPRRKQILSDADCVNIWDYKKKFPFADMPVTYVLIDEVVTLAERMEKEVKKEFQKLLVELISQLPALGIRIFMIPHVIKNDIIAKTATDLIPCRISVFGDAEHIEATTGTNARNFNFKLTKQGDMAVKIPLISAKTMFIHAVALSGSNGENAELFDYMRHLWCKLEPDTIKGSRADFGDTAVAVDTGSSVAMSSRPLMRNTPITATPIRTTATNSVPADLSGSSLDMEDLFSDDDLDMSGAFTDEDVNGVSRVDMSGMQTIEDDEDDFNSVQERTREVDRDDDNLNFGESSSDDLFDMSEGSDFFDF